MSSDKETTDYIELRPGDKVQVGDQWLDQFGQWHFYTHAGDTAGVVGSGVKARRPIRATHQATYEEVPGSRTTQETIINPQRERIAYEELRPGTEVQAGDQYRNTQGRWVEYSMDTSGVPIVGPTAMARRPYNITQMENDRAEAIAELAKLSAELWARKPLEDRVASLTDELANARENIQKLVKTIAENADQFAEHTIKVVHERDEARAELQRVQEVVRNLYNEPTARQVQEMLRTWATELDWSAGCFDSVGREQIDGVQKTLIAVMERIEGMIHPEGGTDGE